MKKLDITTPIIDKCKKLSQFWRMEIYEGCWGILPDDNKIFLITEKIKGMSHNGFRAIYPTLPSFGKITLVASEYIPIPSISDCLERLRELGWRNYQFSIAENGKIEMHIIHVPFTFKKEDEIIVQGTPLEALLSALIKVMKEIKDE